MEQLLQRLVKAVNYYPNKTEQESNIQNYKNIVSKANSYLEKLNKSSDLLNLQISICEELTKIVHSVDSTEYLLLDAQPRIPKSVYLSSYFNYGTILKNIAENSSNTRILELKKNELNRSIKDTKLTDIEKGIYNKSIECFIGVLKISFEDNSAIQQIVSIYTQLCFFSQDDLQESLTYLNQALFHAPNNQTIHYNIGFINQRLNNLELGKIHFKIAIALNSAQDLEAQRLTVNCYNGIASIYRAIRQWPHALYYLLEAKKVISDDPDINNQLGVVYTEMRETGLAKECYQLAIKNSDKTFISTDPKFLKSELYLNFGHMYSYDGDNNKSIECYNKALSIAPGFSLPYQNKLMNLCYLFDQLNDPMYITEQHKLVNKLYKKGSYPTIQLFNFKSKIINIGIISGDFIDHPVSFFISTYLKNFNTGKFKVTCYSETIIDTILFNKNLEFKLIKGMSAQKAADLIHSDSIHILLDMAGHTAHNRLDVFALKPAPIQITYAGYPFTTGLNEMDYRITDTICDNLKVSQAFYTEKLLQLPDFFMCYNPEVIKRDQATNPYKFEAPKIKETPTISNGYLNIGCYNRVNKITDTVISLFNKILLTNEKVVFVFKTKALINKKIKQTFIEKFDEPVRHRIKVLDCTLSHEQHLETYNEIDIAIDTFPYSGTTTSCEALLMGKPVLSIYDSKTFFHPQNVTCSILKNSDLDWFVCDNENKLIEKVKELSENPKDFWRDYPEKIRKQFLEGKVCNKDLFMNNIEKLFEELYFKHKN
jgi:protein O-GlcNAc transferase